MKAVCTFFGSGKTCRSGDKCKFLHDVNPTDGTSSAAAFVKKGVSSKVSALRVDETEGLRKKWLFTIPKDRAKSRPLGDHELERFLELTLDLIHSGTDNMQLVVARLGSECGLLRVREIIDRDFEKMDDTKLESTVTSLLLPLFKILSHDSVLQSMVVETQHTTLLNALYGSNGDRGTNVFTAMARNLSDHYSREKVDISIAVLAGMLERNSSAKANSTLQSVSEVLVSLLDVSNLSRASERHLRSIRTVFSLAINMPEIKTIASHSKPTAPVATFTIAQDLPGVLSEYGPRHDNDSADIQDIKILPTLQEILGERPEYLPHEDPQVWHLSGLAGLIDRQFRLVREDTVGQLRDAVKAQLLHQRSPERSFHVSNQGIRTNAYDEVVVRDMVFDAKNGLLFVLQFKQPPFLQNKSSKKRKEWWEESRRFAPESLICLLSSGKDANEEVTFLVVHTPDSTPANMLSHKKGPAAHELHTLWKDQALAFVIAQLASTEPSAATAFIKNSTLQSHHSIVEFPGVLLPTFGPTLSALQRMAVSLDVPFAEALRPDGEMEDPRPPAYSIGEGFQYDLTSLIPEDQHHQHHPSGNSEDDMVTALELSHLDEKQREAAQHALTHAVALIQGPPGTGKSYTGVKIIQALLENKDKANLGPIICVCYTNHALDQLLEHLLDSGVNQIVRIGSRSKSERLAGVNLRTLTGQQSFSRLEGKTWGGSKSSIRISGHHISELLARLHRNPEKDILVLLKAKYPALYANLPHDGDDDGFKIVQGKKISIFWRVWPKAPSSQKVHGDRDLATLRSGTVEFADMSYGEREVLYNSWVDELTSSISKDLEVELENFNERVKTMSALRGDLQLRVLSRANVVGITTTGLARQLNTLCKLTSKVLVVEEAGEVLEAHLLTAMLPSLEHAILIGDHQQLRPKVQNYDLSVENPRSSHIALDISLFERLIHPRQIGALGLPHVTLNTQRRMHPSVSQLIRSTLYPNLQDADSVTTYPEVVGMRKRLYWVDHKIKEDGQDAQLQSTSRTNRYEVNMVAALVAHLQKQGVYAADDIAVLTPYLGQLRLLREKLKKSFGIILNDRDVDDLAQEDATQKGEADVDGGLAPHRTLVTKGTLLQAIRLATVDNFQGEEAKVVIISLVRSNDSNNCGFLRTPNRINVLLSRAQHGMYIVGNSETASSVAMWSHVLDIFRANDIISTTIELCCPRHPETPLEVTEPDDFTRVAPEAGCGLMCGKQLPCGHACPSKCHSDTLHNGVHCLKDCPRPRKGCKHPCTRPCGDTCEANCSFVVQCDFSLPCGHHVSEMECWQEQKKETYHCQERVTRRVPGCGHDIEVPCHVDLHDTKYRCDQPCSSILGCGHPCQKSCFECRPRGEEGKIEEMKHGECTHECGKSFNNCGHSCPRQCHAGESCPPCSSRCEVSCVHSKCQKECHEPCTPCTEERCPSHCEHSECQMPCGAPCDWVPCSKRCVKRLTCGHQCPSLCGEICPSSRFCQVCATEEIRDITVDLYTMGTYAELDLDTNPCLFPPCGHIFTVETLDGQMEMSKLYNLEKFDELSVPVSTKGDLLPLSYESLKTCPNCRGPLRTIARYGRIVRRALLDESTKKFIAWSNHAYHRFAEQVQQLQGELLKNVGTVPLLGAVSFDGPNSMGPAVRAATAGRYSALIKLRHDLARFTCKVRAEEQPFQVVRDLVESVRRRQNPDIREFEYDHSILQTRGTLLANALGLRCDLIIIKDLLQNWEEMTHRLRSAQPISIDLHKYRLESDLLLESATKAMYPLQQAESHIFWAQFAALECGSMTMSDDDSYEKSEALKDQADFRLDRAQDICNKFPGQTETVKAEVEGVREMLHDSISSAEMRMVVGAMSKEFSITGHWYSCVNGHPFTIGECGRPMEEARCPECNAAIGGQNHRDAAGVTRAENIEREFGDLQL